MVGKWLEMLKQAAPGVSRAALMFNPDTASSYYVYRRSFEAESRSIAVEVAEAPVRNTAEIEEAIAKLGREPGGGLIVPPDAFTILHRQLLIRLAQQHRLPAVYAYRTYVAEGALMSYGPDIYELFRRSASYVAHLEGSQASRSSRSAADEVRTGHQSQDRQGAWPPNSGQAARARQRRDRVAFVLQCVWSLLALSGHSEARIRMSAVGAKRTRSVPI